MDEALYKLCRESARTVLAQQGWGLVADEDAFVNNVYLEVVRRRQDTTLADKPLIRLAVLNRYGHIWHAACQAQQTYRQWRAFKELERELYRVAWFQAVPDRRLAEDATQAALLRIWRSLDTVKDPGAFLQFARLVVIREVRRLRQREADEPIPLTALNTRAGDSDDDTAKPDQEEAAFTPAVPREPSQAEQAIQRQTLEQAIQLCLSHPLQQAVIIGLFIEGKSYKELADQLGVQPRELADAKYKALHKLRTCDAFADWVEGG